MRIIEKIIFKIKSMYKSKITAQIFIYDHSEYLNSGKYRILFIGKTIIYKDSKAKAIIKEQVNQLKTLPLLQYSLALLFSKFSSIKIKNNNKENKGDFILLTKNQDAKIFNYNNKEVYHLVNKRENFNSLKSAYDEFRNFYNIPIIEENNNLKLFVEHYFIADNESFDINNLKNIFVLEYLSKNMVYYYESKEKDFGNIDIFSLFETLPTEVKNTHHYKSILNWVAKNNELKLPMYPSHGDLWIGNIIYFTEEFYIIDWEDSSINSFKYDIFYYITFQSTHRNNNTLIQEFMKGEYDDLLRKLFNSVNLEYNEKLKTNYIIINLIERIANTYKLTKKLDTKILDSIIAYVVEE